MNAAFVLVTAALLTGHHQSAGCSSCGTTTAVSSCDSCCQDSWGHRLQGRLKGLFAGNGCGCHKDACSTCSAPAPTCCAPAPAPAPAPTCCAPAPTCCDSGHHRHHAQTSCDSCNSSGGFFGRFRGMFNRGHGSSGCCDAGCSTCGSGCASGSCGTAAPPAAAPAPGGETIKDAPKKLPAAPKGGQVQAEPAPLNVVPEYQPVIQNRPAVAVPSSLRNPF